MEFRPEARAARRVTVDDVARHAGVSQTTVSQVLNGSRPVSAATHARVSASIEELGFRRNDLARALRQQKSWTVAIVVPNITHVTYPMVARGASEILRPLGYQVALYDTDHDVTTETYVISTLVDRMADGAIVFGFPIKDADADLLATAQVPFVNGGLDDAHVTRWDSVRVDQSLAVSRMVGELSDSHLGPIAFIGGPADEGSALPRREGYRAGVKAAGHGLDERLITSAPYSFEGGRAALERLLSSGVFLRSVVCANDLIAIGAMQAARDHGLRVPQDIAITGYDNIEAAQMTIPPLTTVDAFPFEQGRECARLLLARMTDDPDRPPRHEVLPTSLVRRSSS